MAIRSLVVAFAIIISISNAAQVELCGQYQNVTTTSGLYTIDTDQWGQSTGNGQQCLYVDPDYEPAPNSTAMHAVWTWSALSTEVHSFPNVNLNSQLIPLPLYNLRDLTLDVSWTLGPGSSPSGATVVSDLVALQVRADVALDMFLDVDVDKAQNSSAATYESMVWLSNYGGVMPIGWRNDSQAPAVEISGSTFALSIGKNGVNQTVFTWLPSSNLSSFSGDVSPLLHFLWRQNFIPEAAALGVVQFGNEAEHSGSGQYITFSASKVRMDMQAGEPKPAAPIATATATPSQTTESGGVGSGARSARWMGSDGGGRLALGLMVALAGAL